MPEGEARFSYVPGQRRPADPPIEEADYTVLLRDYGKSGAAGWKQKNPAKWPYRMCRYDIEGTQSTVAPGPRQVTEVLSLHPVAVRRLYDIAEATQFPQAINFPFPTTPADPSVRAAAAQVERVLAWVKQNRVPMQAHLTNEEYRGRMQTRIDYFLSPLAVEEEALVEEGSAETPGEVLEEALYAEGGPAFEVNVLEGEALAQEDLNLPPPPPPAAAKRGPPQHIVRGNGPQQQAAGAFSAQQRIPRNATPAAPRQTKGQSRTAPRARR